MSLLRAKIRDHRKMWVPAPKFWRLYVQVGLMLLVVFPIFVWLKGPRGEELWWILGLAPAILAALVAILVSVDRRWPRDRLGVLSRRQCLACGGSMADAVAEPDGCTVCPECGAAWKLG